MATTTSIELSYHVYDALQLVVNEAIPCVDRCLSTWHSNQSLPPCTGQCPIGKKPESSTACQACVRWGQVIEDILFDPPVAVQCGSQLNWTSVNPSSLGKSHVEVAKLFIVRSPYGSSNVPQAQYNKLADFDSASLLMIMSRFAPFHFGTKESYDLIKKIDGIRNELSCISSDDKQQCTREKGKQYFIDIKNFITCLEAIYPQHFPAHDVRGRLAVTERRCAEIIMATFEEVKPTLEMLDTALAHLKTCHDFTTKEAKNALNTIDESIGQKEHTYDQDCKIASYLVNHGYCQLFGKMWNGLSGYLEKDKILEHDEVFILQTMLNTYSCYVELCAEFATEVGTYGIIPLLLTGICKLKYLYDTEELETLEWLELLFGILFTSISRCKGNYKLFGEANAVSILKSSLKANNKLISIMSLMILAFVVDETESGILATLDGAMADLVYILGKAIESSDHGKSDIPARDVLDCLNHLAINDDNKLVIQKADGIPLIVRMLQDDFDEKEQSVAAEAVWNLAFLESIRTSPQLQQAIPCLDKLRKSQNRNLRKVSSIAYWEINENRPEDLPTRETNPGTNPGGTNPEEPPPSYEESIKEPSQAIGNTAQVMISYQWDYKPIAVKIRNDLVDRGFRIWFDDTNMEDDILNSMADAVEKSDVIIMLMSETYKNSQSCRTEAKYAYKLNKKVIPLMVEKGYKADGWLGALLGTKLYYRFYTEDLTKTDMQQLLKALKESVHGSRALDQPEGPMGATGAHASLSSGTKPSTSDWTEQDVQEWLKKLSLDGVCDALEGFDGSHLEELYENLIRDPIEFKDEMRSDFQMNTNLCVKFTVALKKLYQK